jgi:hypothetical protein
MRTKLFARAAAILVGIEGIALAVVVFRQVVALATGDTDSVESAIALVILTGIGAVILIGFAVAIWRGQSWARSGGIVAQVLILAVALGAATGAYAQPVEALAIAAPALVGLILLVLASRRGPASRDAGDEAPR